jgi:hypothetical protein
MKHQHGLYLALKLVDLDSRVVTEIIPVIKENLMTDAAKGDVYERGQIFNGRCGYYNDLVTTTWLADDEHYIFNSFSQGLKGIFMVNVDTKRVTTISEL